MSRDRSTVAASTLGILRICSAVADRGQRVAEFVGQGRQELVLAAVGVPQRLVELGVLDGDPGPVRQVHRQGEVGIGVRSTRLGGGERQDAERVAGDDQRHADVRLQAQRADQVAGAVRPSPPARACRR